MQNGIENLQILSTNTGTSDIFKGDNCHTVTHSHWDKSEYAMVGRGEGDSVR